MPVAALLEEFGHGDARERSEAWRYSRHALQALSQQDFSAADSALQPSPGLLARCDWPETRGRRLVFVNGRYAASHSDGGELASPVDDGGATRLRIDGDDRCIHVVFAHVPGRQAARWSSELVVEARGRRARLLEQHVGDDGAELLGAVRVRVDVGDGASLQTTTLADLPDGASLYRRAEIRVRAGAAYEDVKALFGGRLQRHEDELRLDGELARYRGRGVFALRGRQHVDVHLDATHAARNTTSDVLWRGVADQRARGVLHGAIKVAAGADGADARLETKNLLLSPHAEIDAQPVLEIYADEVKASHGATVGQLDPRALFYLRSRGIPAAQARSLLIGGFCREAAVGLDAPLRARIDALIERRLPQAPAQPA